MTHHICDYMAFVSNVLKKGELRILGIYCVLSIIHGGNGYPFLAQPVFDYFATGAYNSINVPTSEIPDPILQLVIEKVQLTVSTDSKLALNFSTACSALTYLAAAQC